MTQEELIKAIRGNPLIGRGTCSSVDECYDDKDLWEQFGPPSGHHTVEEAVRFAVETEGLYWENGTNQRWGDDDDPQLKMSQDFEARRKEHGY